MNPSKSSSGWSFHPDHQAAVNRSRRIIVQYDPCFTLSPANSVTEWKEYGFQYFDQQNSQVDAVWWDFDPNHEFADPVWDHADPDIDLLDVLLNETHSRGLEAFWHHRISEVDIGPGGLSMSQLNPIKKKHPDWLIKTWWWQGMWNLDVPEVRDFKVELFQQMSERYDFNGYQIDFHRHLPVLPVGRQWELRDSVTDLMRRLRETLLESSIKKNIPILFSAKVPRSLDFCKADGLDIERWVKEDLVDMLTLGSRSYEVDIEGYRKTLGPKVKLYPCLDDHHASDAYHFASLELLRGVSSSWWRQGANGIETFNWYGGQVPQSSLERGANPGPKSHQLAYCEIGNPETLKGKSKIFPVERRGGFPWSEGALGKNLHAQLPVKLAYDGAPANITIYCAEDINSRTYDVSLRLTLFNSEPGDTLDIRLNGNLLSDSKYDYGWKDPKIFSPLPQPNAGSYGYRDIDPQQELLLVTCNLNQHSLSLGNNRISIAVTYQTPHILRQLQVEKVEIHIIQKES